jgi:hypothetical protein
VGLSADRGGVLEEEPLHEHIQVGAEAGFVLRDGCTQHRPERVRLNPAERVVLSVAFAEREVFALRDVPQGQAFGCKSRGDASFVA